MKATQIMKMKNTSLLILLWIIFAASVPVRAQGQGKLYFSFISSAYYMEKHWGQGEPFEGIRRIAETAHANGVPVTWLVNAKSAEAAADLFTEYHEKFGDEVALIITPSVADSDPWGGESFYMRKKLSRKALYNWAKSELERVQAALPWAEVTMAGSGHRSRAMIEVFERLGMKAVWGHCWEQAYTDGISDRGAPWGFYYVFPEAYKIPNPENGGLVAVEWTARDLNLSFRTGRPEVFSTDPNDVERAKIVEHRDIEYWRAFVDEYARNAQFNAVVPLMVHQEAHEMECTDAVCANKEPTIQSTAEMLDELFKYVRESGIEIVPASQAVAAYRAANESTPPTYALFRNLTSLIEDKPASGYNSGQSVEQLAAHEDIFVYYDKNGQLFFDKGAPAPVFVRNYLDVTDASMDDGEFAAPAELPRLSLETEPFVGGHRFHVRIQSPEQMAYGVALWGDYAGCRLPENAPPGAAILGSDLAFWPLIAEPGDHSIDIEINCE